MCKVWWLFHTGTTAVPLRFVVVYEIEIFERRSYVTNGNANLRLGVVVLCCLLESEFFWYKHSNCRLPDQRPLHSNAVLTVLRIAALL